MTGSDPKWLDEKNKYSKNKIDDSNSEIRYRDWDTLKYWFRGVEKFTPWVNNIFFITYGHIPEWLNTQSKNLKIIRHDEYIPKEYLPTFNSNVIEIYMNKIQGLSEYFVYFNDDMFIVNNLRKDDFFQNGKVKDALIFNSVSAKKDNNIIEHTILNNMEVLSRHFDKKSYIKNNILKVFNYKYGKLNLKSLLLLPWKYFTGIENPHMPIPFLKETFDTVWEYEEDIFIQMSNNRFRTKEDYSQWVFRYWQLLEGRFIPKSLKRCGYYDLKNDNSKFLNDVIKKKYDMICINDSDKSIQFEKVKNDLITTFERILPEKSSFEK